VIGRIRLKSLKPPVKWALAIVAALLVGLLVGVVSAWRERSRAAELEQAGQAPATAPPASVEGQGRLQAVNVISIAPPVDGTLRLEPVKVGDEVYEGQLLASIENTEIDTAVQRAQQELKQAEDRVHDLENQYASARLEASRARAELVRAQDEFEAAQKEAQRQKRLYEEGATPRLVYQEAQRRFDAEREKYEVIRQAAQLAEERVQSLQNELERARKRRQEAQQALEDAIEDSTATQVVSPARGVLIGIARDSGEEVSPEMGPLFQIAVDLSRMQVVVDVPPDQLVHLRPGMQADVTVADVPGEKFSGEVVRVGHDGVVVEFVNPSPAVRPGATAFVRIKLR